MQINENGGGPLVGRDLWASLGTAACRYALASLGTVADALANLTAAANLYLVA